MNFNVVFVTVGTTRFDKLISSITDPTILKQLEDRGCKQLVLQIGHGEEPATVHCSIDISWYRFKPSLSEDIVKADLVIGHAGAGTCLEVLSAGKPLIIVTNRQLMDSHQQELAMKLHSLNYLVYTELEELGSTVSKFDSNLMEPYRQGDPSVFSDFIDKLVGVS